MLCQARGGLDMTADVQAIFDICASFPLSSEGAFWGHNHERLQPLEPPEGEDGFLNLYSGENFSLGSDCHYAENPMDPNVLPELHDMLARLEHHPNPVEDAQNIIGRCAKESLREERKQLPCVSRTSSPLLRRLPNEIISAILLHLPSVSVRNLQLADPIFTEAQNFLWFWESRFAPDCDFWYVNETKPGGLGNRWDLWDQLCMKYHNCRTAINRRRTLRLTRRMCDLIHQRHENAKLLRHSTSDITNDEDFWLNNSHDDKISLCRVPNITGLVDQTIELADDLRHVAFSFKTVANQRYISGLRLYGANNQERTLGYFYSTGYSTPPCSHQSRAGEYITGFDIALDNLGIRGLRVLTESGKPFGWVGEQKGLPKRRLIATLDDGNSVPPTCEADQGFKLVGIAICSTSDPWPSISYGDECFALEDGREVQCEEQQVDRPMVPEKETWYPDLPPLGLTYVQLNKADRPLQQPYHYCIFGGSRGERLGHLDRIIIRADKHVRSVAFYFDKDGEKTEQVEFTRPRYGLELGEKMAVVSLAIDGAGGERITRVESILDPSTKILSSLQKPRFSPARDRQSARRLLAARRILATRRTH
ncbi:hypothetical protein J3458_002303 [Metarhizium acridum]|uniref:uncharacterized protein n=1 Tax=Metarhizium acridum TaxID=92637 RepID=UPI001C6B1363|nr:hypothetical protein J3458_002303 [Metarhizium acridum]